MRPGDELPPGYGRAVFEERLKGCGLIVGGLVGMGVAILFWKFGLTTLLMPQNVPAGFTPISSPVACMVPLMAVLSAGLVLVGLRKLLTGD